MSKETPKKIRIVLKPDEQFNFKDLLYDGDDMRPQVAYGAWSRYFLGTESVDKERMDEIGRKIASGEYIGLPVYAYVHSGVLLSTRKSYPYNDPWDAGQSGFVYITKANTGFKRLTKKRLAEVKKRCEDVVKRTSAILSGDVWGIVAERLDYIGSSGREYYTEEDSCWGFVGGEYANEEAKAWANGYRAEGWEVTL